MMKIARLNKGVGAALTAAVLFGASAPLAKILLDRVDPWLLAALLYLGSGVGLTLYRVAIRAPRVRLPSVERLWFAGAVVAGGVVGPVLLMLGLVGMPAAGASLLLNAEGVFTALLAWFVFKENFDRKIAMGMVAIALGATVLSFSGEARFGNLWSSALVLSACLAWAVDNNLTRQVSLSDATWIASIKGLVAGFVNLSLALLLGATWPRGDSIAMAMLIGFFAYGVSLTLFVVALAHLGTARSSAYFSVAPFVGALIAVLLGEPVTGMLLAAGLLMSIGLWLHLSEHHVHEHTHEALTHEHTHRHDDHHQHAHEFPIDPETEHCHAHVHLATRHTHAHLPDIHHRHGH